jgi:hypothetical protein
MAEGEKIVISPSFRSRPQMRFQHVMQEIGIKPIIEDPNGRFPSASTG